MRNYILVVLILFLTSCKTTPEDYSKYGFIDQFIRTKDYETYTLIPQGYELRSVYGHQYPSSSDISKNAERTLALPFILFDKKLNSIFFFSTKEDKYTPFTIKYNFEKNTPIFDIYSNKWLTIGQHTQTTLTPEGFYKLLTTKAKHTCGKSKGVTLTISKEYKEL